MKKFLAIFLCAVLAAGCLTACGTQTSAGQQGQQSAQQGSEQPAQDPQPAQQGSASGAQAADPAPTSEELYNEFMAGSVSVTVDYDDAGLEQGRYSAGELADAYAAYLSEEDREFFLGDAYYSLIDCGADGEPELALTVEFYVPGDYYEEFDQLWVIKNYDGELKLIADDYSAYRTWCTINEYGYISSGGSSSAASMYFENSFLNAKGERVFLHSVSYNLYQSEAVIPSYELPSGVVPEDLEYGLDFDEDGYELDIYNFTELTGEMLDGGEKYDDYLRGNMFVFLAPDGSSEVSIPREYMLLYEEHGVQLYSDEEMQALLQKHVKELGASEKIISGEEVSWTKIDPDLTDWIPKG